MAGYDSDGDYGYDSSTPAQCVSAWVVSNPKSEAGNGSGNYEWIDRQRYEDKRSGDYSSVITREKYTTHSTVEKGTGRVGVKEEHKVTVTHNFGNKSTGFSGRHVKQEGYQTVNYGGSSRKYLS